MITNHTTTNSGTQAGEVAERHVHTDSESWARASEFLVKLVGTTLDDLRWDDTHHLQGHAHLNGRELVVIAPRDDRHETVVFVSEDWDAVCRADRDHREDLLRSCAIADHDRLVALL